MSKQTEALKLALEALQEVYWSSRSAKHDEAIAALREALAEQPAIKQDLTPEQLAQRKPWVGPTDFIKHEVENAYDWSEWVCPDPESYLMKCCDCGLVHEAQFRVAKYKPAPSDECEVVSDPDLQAQFRMRRSEQWSPEDTAHRSGGLPMAEQPAQPQEPEQSEIFCGVDFADGLLSVSVLRRRADDVAELLHLEQIALPAQQEPVAYGLFVNGELSWDSEWAFSNEPFPVQFDDEECRPLYTSPPASKPWVGLTDEERVEVLFQNPHLTVGGLLAVEAKLKEKND